MGRTKLEMPQTEALAKIMELSGTSMKAIKYFLAKFKERLTDPKMLEQYSGVQKKLQEYADLSERKLRPRTEIWSGKAGAATDFKWMHKNIKSDEEESIISEGIPSDVILDVAIGDGAELLRGYSSGGKALDSNLVDSFDKILNACFAEGNVVSQGSILYQSDEHGQIKLDDQGNQVRATSAQLNVLIEGFEKELASDGIPITYRLQEYPSAQQEVQAQMPVEAAISTPAPATAEVPTPDEPRPSGGMGATGG
jgi:hypothetical protein